jgi:hypothetical protein
MAVLLFIASIILMLIGSVMLLIEAFSAGMLWGFGTLLFPLPVGLFFVVTHWYQAKKAFIMQVIGIVLFFVAGYVSQQR